MFAILKLPSNVETELYDAKYRGIALVLIWLNIE